MNQDIDNISTESQKNCNQSDVSSTHPSVPLAIPGTESSQQSEQMSPLMQPLPINSQQALLPMASNKNQILVIRLIMHGKEAGSIIGKKGENVKKFREETGARINISDSTFSERIVTISGSLDQVVAAFQLICCRFEEDLRQLNIAMGGQESASQLVGLRLILPAIQCGSIIGQNGCKIREIRENSGASVQISGDLLPGSTERMLTVAGDVEAVVRAVLSIGKLILECPVKGSFSQYKPRSFKPVNLVHPLQYAPINNNNSLGNNVKNANKNNSDFYVGSRGNDFYLGNNINNTGCFYDCNSLSGDFYGAHNGEVYRGENEVYKERVLCDGGLLERDVEFGGEYFNCNSSFFTTSSVFVNHNYTEYRYENNYKNGNNKMLKGKYRNNRGCDETVAQLNSGSSKESVCKGFQKNKLDKTFESCPNDDDETIHDESKNIDNDENIKLTENESCSRLSDVVFEQTPEINEQKTKNCHLNGEKSENQNSVSDKSSMACVNKENEKMGDDWAVQKENLKQDLDESMKQVKKAEDPCKNYTFNYNTSCTENSKIENNQKSNGDENLKISHIANNTDTKSQKVQQSHLTTYTSQPLMQHNFVPPALVAFPPTVSHAAVQSSADKLGNTFCSYIHNTPFNTNASNDTTYQNNNNVSDITNQNDTLKVPSNISLTSPQKNKNLINNNMFYLTTPTNPYHLTYSITIPNDTIGCVIGRGGARINEIRQRSGANIKISSSDEEGRDRVVVINGPSEAVMTALQLIELSLESHKTNSCNQGGTQPAFLAPVFLQNLPNSTNMAPFSIMPTTLNELEYQPLQQPQAQLLPRITQQQVLHQATLQPTLPVQLNQPQQIIQPHLIPSQHFFITQPSEIFQQPPILPPLMTQHQSQLLTQPIQPQIIQPQLLQLQLLQPSNNSFIKPPDDISVEYMDINESAPCSSQLSPQIFYQSNPHQSITTPLYQPLPQPMIHKTEDNGKKDKLHNLTFLNNEDSHKHNSDSKISNINQAEKKECNENDKNNQNKDASCRQQYLVPKENSVNKKRVNKTFGTTSHNSNAYPSKKELSKKNFSSSIEICGHKNCNKLNKINFSNTINNMNNNTFLENHNTCNKYNNECKNISSQKHETSNAPKNMKFPQNIQQPFFQMPLDLLSQSPYFIENYSFRCNDKFLFINNPMQNDAWKDAIFGQDSGRINQQVKPKVHNSYVLPPKSTTFKFSPY